MEVALLVNDEENVCRFEVQREGHWIYMQLMVKSCRGKVAGVVL